MTKKSITFRLDAENLEALEKIAKNEGISVNSLTNIIMEYYLKWHVFSGKSGLVSFPKRLLQEMLEVISEKKVSQMAQLIAESEVPDIILLMRTEYSPNSFIDIIETWAKISNFPFSHKIKDNTHDIILQHNMGSKWSLYLAELFKDVFDKFEIPSKIFKTNNTVTISMDIVISKNQNEHVKDRFS